MCLGVCQCACMRDTCMRCMSGREGEREREREVGAGEREELEQRERKSLREIDR